MVCTICVPEDPVPTTPTRFPVKSMCMGEAVKAVIVAADGIVADAALADELLSYVKSRIARYRCPQTIDFVDSLPRTPSGKLQKRLVRDRYWQGRASRLA